VTSIGTVREEATAASDGTETVFIIYFVMLKLLYRDLVIQYNYYIPKFNIYLT
jgi:hypothetical protein